MYGLVGAFILSVASALDPAEGAQLREHREQVGEWQVRAFSAGSCSVKRDFGDGTSLLVSSDRDGRAYISVLKAAWPLRATDSYRLALIQGGSRRNLTGEDDGIFRGLGLWVPNSADFLGQLAEGGLLEVAGAGGAVLGRVDLNGIAPALARLGLCVTEIATAENFPRMAAPPAPPPPRLSRRGKAERARARVTLPQLFSDEDYPVSAVRAGEQGAVGFRLDVGTDSRVAVCAVTASSGSAALDTTTCRLLTARARFLPALDRKGRPTTDSLNGRIVWRLPEPEPPPPPPTS